MITIRELSRTARRQVCLLVAAVLVCAGLTMVSAGVEATFRVAQAEVTALHSAKIRTAALTPVTGSPRGTRGYAGSDKNRS